MFVDEAFAVALPVVTLPPEPVEFPPVFAFAVVVEWMMPTFPIFIEIGLEQFVQGGGTGG